VSLLCAHRCGHPLVCLLQAPSHPAAFLLALACHHHIKLLETLVVEGSKHSASSVQPLVLPCRQCILNSKHAATSHGLHQVLCPPYCLWFSAMGFCIVLHSALVVGCNISLLDVSIWNRMLSHNSLCQRLQKVQDRPGFSCKYCWFPASSFCFTDLLESKPHMPKRSQ
jgi:hypothetical protein